MESEESDSEFETVIVKERPRRVPKRVRKEERTPIMGGESGGSTRRRRRVETKLRVGDRVRVNSDVFDPDEIGEAPLSGGYFLGTITRDYSQNTF
jgi:transcription antitermination factor NusG